jgi:hypothetical protein
MKKAQAWWTRGFCCSIAGQNHFPVKKQFFAAGLMNALPWEDLRGEHRLLHVCFDGWILVVNISIERRPKMFP